MYHIFCVFFGGSSQAIEFIKLPIKYVDPDDGVAKFELQDWPVMDPHSISAFLFDEAGLRIPTATLREYWEHNARFHEPWAQQVALGTMPLGIYGDSARVSTKFGSTNLVGVWFSFPLWKPCSVRASRFLLTVIPDEKCWKHHTMTTIMRRVTWSLNCLMDGAHPSAGVYGEALPSRLQALAGKKFLHPCKLVEIRGDWQWHKRIWRFFQCSWNSHKMCYMCKAMAVSDDPADLYWRYENNNWETQFSLEDFIAERMPPTGICSLFQIMLVLLWFSWKLYWWSITSFGLSMQWLFSCLVGIFVLQSRSLAWASPFPSQHDPLVHDARDSSGAPIRLQWIVHDSSHEMVIFSWSIVFPARAHQWPNT